MTPAELDAIEARLNHGGDDWSPREIEMKGDIAALLAEVRRLLAPPLKVARWGKGSRRGSWDGYDVLRLGHRVVAAYCGTGIAAPEWTVEIVGRNMRWRFPTEPEARAHIESWAKSKGWEVRDAE